MPILTEIQKAFERYRNTPFGRSTEYDKIRAQYWKRYCELRDGYPEGFYNNNKFSYYYKNDVVFEKIRDKLQNVSFSVGDINRLQNE